MDSKVRSYSNRVLCRKDSVTQIISHVCFSSLLFFSDIGQKSHKGTSEEDIILEQRKNQTVTKLHEILRPFLLRRVKVDVLKEMPPKKEIVVYSGMSKLQLGYADLIEKGVLRDELLRQGIADGKNLSQTNKMMNHRKNVNHPFIFGEPLDPSTGVHIGTKHPQLLVRASGKFALMDRMLERLHRGMSSSGCDTLCFVGLAPSPFIHM